MIYNLHKLLKIRIFHNDKIIRVYHSPHEVIVKPKAKRVEIYGTNGILTEEYDLVGRDLSWLENEGVDCAEIILDLKVVKLV